MIMKKRLHLLILLFLFSLSAIAGSAISQTVYITNSGKKYHKEDCRYLSKSSIAISLQDAKEQSYTACKVCKPGGSSENSFYDDQDYTNSQSAAITKKGTQCKRSAKGNSGYCWQHGGN